MNWNYWLSYVPTMDGQTVLSLILGTAVSLWTFYIGYKKTVGAREERVRAANLDLISVVRRRVSVEREQVTIDQFAAMVESRAYRMDVPAKRLFGLSAVCRIIIADTIENEYLDKESKQAILDTVTRTMTHAGATEMLVAQQEDDWNSFSRIGLFLISGIAGVTSAAVVSVSASGLSATPFEIMVALGPIVFGIGTIWAAVTAFRNAARVKRDFARATDITRSVRESIERKD